MRKTSAANCSNVSLADGGPEPCSCGVFSHFCHLTLCPFLERSKTAQNPEHPATTMVQTLVEVSNKERFPTKETAFHTTDCVSKHTCSVTQINAPLLSPASLQHSPWIKTCRALFMRFEEDVHLLPVRWTVDWLFITQGTLKLQSEHDYAYHHSSLSSHSASSVKVSDTQFRWLQLLNT